jgi:hypothetical protein
MDPRILEIDRRHKRTLGDDYRLSSTTLVAPSLLACTLNSRDIGHAIRDREVGLKEYIPISLDLISVTNFPKHETSPP